MKLFDLPGINAMNFLLHNTLGGGGSSSLHVDPLAKTYGQRLLEMEVEAPAEWAFPATSRLCPTSLPSSPTVLPWKRKPVPFSMVAEIGLSIRLVS